MDSFAQGAGTVAEHGIGLTMAEESRAAGSLAADFIICPSSQT
jgi:hypothetical protein